MCISPIPIKNPNYGLTNQPYKDCVSAYIGVPCGHCPECVFIRQSEIVQRCQSESISNHLFMCTLTYNNESLPVWKFSNGREHSYADVSDVQKMFKRLRKKNAFGRPFRYFGVNEFGKRSRPHFHILFFVPKHDDDDEYSIYNLERLMWRSVLAEWQRNYGTRKNPDYRPLCTYVCKVVRGKLSTNYDLHYVRPDPLDGTTDNVAFYVSKYLMKGSKYERRLQQALRLNLPEEEYNAAWSVIKCRYFASLGFGVNGEKTPFGIEPDPKIVERIRHCVDLSKRTEDSPKFFNSCTGQSFPLARYYKSKFYCFDINDFKVFWSRNHNEDNVVYDDRTLSDKLLFEEQYSKKLEIVDKKDSLEILNDF